MSDDTTDWHAKYIEMSFRYVDLAMEKNKMGVDYANEILDHARTLQKHQKLISELIALSCYAERNMKAADLVPALAQRIAVVDINFRRRVEKERRRETLAMHLKTMGYCAAIKATVKELGCSETKLRQQFKKKDKHKWDS